MAAWHRSRRTDLGLRAAGLLLCGLAYAAIVRLVALHASPPWPGTLAYGLAAIGVVAGSGGGAMLFLGHHLFDEVEVGAHRSVAGRFSPSEGLVGMDMPESAMLVVGRDVDGDWTVRESAGMLLGRFASAQAAHRFAEAERRGRASVTVATSAGTPHRIEGRLTLGGGRPAKAGPARG